MNKSVCKKTSSLLSHQGDECSLEDAVRERQEKIRRRGDLPGSTVEQQLELVEQLAAFPLGQFLLQHGGLNGFWADYILMHPHTGRITGRGADGKVFSKVESFLLNRAPTVLATQERFEIFRYQTQMRLKNDFRVISVPCGLMSDLLTLDYSKANDFQLVGIDLDLTSIHYATQRAKEYRLAEQTAFILGDAWAEGAVEPADLLLSNGLNIYVDDEEKVIDLYKNFHRLLKPNGLLITSFLTPTPEAGDHCEWHLEHIDIESIKKQNIILNDVLNVKWNNYCSADRMVWRLTEAGFQDIQIIPDTANIFPTVVALRN